MAQVTLNGADYYYEVHGSGPTLILIAGYACDHAAWIPLLPGLTKHFQVVLFDNRGVGLTTDDNRPLSAELIASDVIALMDALQFKQAHIVGHSMGGSIAQYVAAYAPDRINKLMLVNTTVKWRQAMLAGLRTSLELRMSNINFDLIFQATLPWLVGEEFLNNKNKVEFFKKTLLENPNPQSLENQARQFKLLETVDARPILNRIKAETLVVSGRQDLLSLPYESSFLADSLSRSHLVTLDDAHVPMIENARELLSALRDFALA